MSRPCLPGNTSLPNTRALNLCIDDPQRMMTKILCSQTMTMPFLEAVEMPNALHILKSSKRTMPMHRYLRLLDAPRLPTTLPMLSPVESEVSSGPIVGDRVENSPHSM
eukprot:CAMPEP_0175962126 /NCGR_PEP_ID=MMETSP0108-20121206/36312_1 /TAXON_ID=195067 ORGANISM="Goniomonas pacifica, Strain CCMP1869" /NCGR_SAMPLE_ID=MMETSP0108 /ASSEMBLY_ACC=CAM_ASM_000204 /LENGTH=107 /DNA_ID=CAMNT_0017289921 /DNA_START=912 /DNA_END=1235 /DNA_ORIENTATION=-